MLRKTLVVSALAGFALAGVALAQNPPVTPSPVKRTIVAKIEVPDSNYEVITAMLEIAPGFKAGRHFHPGLVTGHILEGTFWYALDGEPEKTFGPGEAVAIPMKGIHNEGAVGDKPMKAVVTYVVEKGQPLVQPVK